MKAATGLGRSQRAGVQISIHAAREGGDAADVFLLLFVFISIHAAREGGDLLENHTDSEPAISIHAAREGGDRCEFRL